MKSNVQALAFRRYDGNTFTLTYAAGVNGSLTGTASQTAARGQDGTTVTAVPDGGFAFDGWSDGVATAARTDADIKSDINVTATFVAE